MATRRTSKLPTQADLDREKKKAQTRRTSKLPTQSDMDRARKDAKRKETSTSLPPKTLKEKVKQQADWLWRSIKSDFLPTEERQKVQDQIAKEERAEYNRKGGFKNDKVGQFYTGFGEGFINSSLPGIAYSIATGKKLSESDVMTKPPKGNYKPKKIKNAAAQAYVPGRKNKTQKETSKKIASFNPFEVEPTKNAAQSRKIGNIAGEMLGYATGYGAAEKATTKAAGKVLATKAGKKATEKAVASKVGKKIGEEATKQVLKSATKNAIADATVGTAMDLGLARGEGKKGKELAKDMAVNAGINAVTGGVMEAIPVVKALKGSKKAVKKELPKVVKQAVMDEVTPKVELPKTISEQAENIKIEPKIELPTANSIKNPVEISSQSNVNLKDLGADVARPNQAFKDAKKKYGTYDGGKVPLRTDMGKVTQGANTVYNSPIVDKKTREVIKANIEEGSYWTRKTTNKEKLDLASDKIKTNGLDFETKSFENIIKEGKEVRSDDIAMGYQLAREHINKGNYEAAQTVLSDVCQMESEAGRTLQAMRLFNSLSPEGRVKNVIRSVDKIKKNTGVNVNISDEMLDRLRNASEEELPELRKQINIELWNQVPATFSEKLTAWRYLAMLGNPRTHIRNIVGNALYVPVVRMDNIIQSGLQKAFSRKLEKVGAKKTAAILTNSSDDRALKKFAGDQFDKLRKTLDSGNGKYNEELRPLEAKVFNNRLLEGANKLNSAALEAEDQLFMKINFDSAFAQYCKANGKKVGDLTEEFVQQASEHAYNEALRATYRDPSRLADALARFRKNLNVKATDDATMKVAKTAGKVVMDSALPFTKTPINILKRGVSHSPLGLAKGMYQIARAKDAVALQKAITQVAEGLTGTGVVALGMYMGNKGLANGSLGEYNSEYKWKQLLGKQDYALNIGDYSITMDWAAPICMPFFVGVELGNSMLKEGGNLWDGIESLSQIYQPVLEMSMLSGVQNLFDFANGDSKDIVKFMGNAAQNLVSQFIPTLVGQTARTLVPERKIALSTAENKLQRDTEKYIDKLENKIPGLTNTNQSFVDMFGRTDSKQSPTDYLKAGLENFLSPAYVQKKETDRTALELENLRQELGSEGKDVIPTDYSSRYTVRYDGRDIRMTPEQFTEYKKVRGQEVYKGLSSLTSSSEYQNMTTDEKKEAVRDVYEAASDAAKRSIVISMGETTKNAYDYGELNKTQKALVDSGTMSVSQVKEANQILSESGADSSAGKAYALAESGMNKDAVIAMTSKTAVEKATKLREAGATKEDVINAARTIRESGYTKNIGKAYALLDSGQSTQIVSTLLSDSAVKRATAIKRAGITPEMLDHAAGLIDANGNGRYSNDELKGFLSIADISREQKWALFEALKASPKTKNPF
jgi:hypothetical protein